MPTIFAVAPTETRYDALTRDQLRLLISALRGASKTIGTELDNTAIDTVVDRIAAVQDEQFGYLRRPTIGTIKHGLDGILDTSHENVKPMLDAISLVIRGIATSQMLAEVANESVTTLRNDEVTADEVRSVVTSFTAGYPFQDQADAIADTTIENSIAQSGFLRRPFTTDFYTAVSKVTGIGELSDYDGLTDRIFAGFTHLRGLTTARRH